MSLFSALVLGIASQASKAQSTFVGLSLIDPAVTEEYSFEDAWVPPGPLPTSTIDSATLVDSVLKDVSTGSAYAEQGVLKARAQSFSPDQTVLSVAGFTDAVTFFADGEEGEAGTLHLEYELDGHIFVSVGSLAGVSLNMLIRDRLDLPNLYYLRSL